MTLPQELVKRSLPDLLNPDDAKLFAAEEERTFPPIETKTVSGDFFPSGWHHDAVGWKGRLKNVSVLLATRQVPFVPQLGRTPLIATDRFSNGYFHWVTETLPRLWWIREQLKELELVLPAFAARLPYMVQSLALFPELRFRIIDSRTRWQVSDALLIPALAPGGNYRPEQITELGGAWRRKVNARAPFRKLYISRSKATRRRIANQDAVTAALEAKGFETVHLEGMAFEKQVQLLAETVHVISNHGAGLTNIMFMAPGTRVTEIRLRGDAHNNCYFSLARAIGLDYHYRLADPVVRGQNAHHADLRVDAEHLL